MPVIVWSPVAPSHMSKAVASKVLSEVLEKVGSVLGEKSSYRREMLSPMKTVAIVVPMGC
ncbi:hypothetical protein TIFTF001_032131 [Ficus carica]|uniref:Uncharacterized protein n=1 Tax=Ficus carica TaxID=3494 RepID=A0AA88J216_FICCA|nr:hypothetical protein TIFTF001_032131 [Ficus carica]